MNSSWKYLGAKTTGISSNSPKYHINNPLVIEKIIAKRNAIQDAIE